MAYPDIATKEDLANELLQTAFNVRKAEELISYVESITTAILDGGLLDALPADDSNRARHNAAVHLLSDINCRIAELENLPGTDPSISLEVLAKDIASGRFAHKRVLEAN